MEHDFTDLSSTDHLADVDYFKNAIAFYTSAADQATSEKQKSFYQSCLSHLQVMTNERREELVIPNEPIEYLPNKFKKPVIELEEHEAPKTTWQDTAKTNGWKPPVESPEPDWLNEFDELVHDINNPPTAPEPADPTLSWKPEVIQIKPTLVTGYLRAGYYLKSDEPPLHAEANLITPIEPPPKTDVELVLEQIKHIISTATKGFLFDETTPEVLNVDLIVEPAKPIPFIDVEQELADALVAAIAEEFKLMDREEPTKPPADLGTMGEAWEQLLESNPVTQWEPKPKSFFYDFTNKVTKKISQVKLPLIKRTLPKINKDDIINRNHRVYPSNLCPEIYDPTSLTEVYIFPRSPPKDLLFKDHNEIMMRMISQVFSPKKPIN